MPAILSTVRCNYCREQIKIEAMHVSAAVCNSCFDQHFFLCIQCGEATTISRSSVRDGDRICYKCIDQESCYDAPERTPQPLKASITTYEKMTSRRKFGIELETSDCYDYKGLPRTCDWGVKEDPSVSGMEFDSPIMYGDSGFKALDEILDYADENHWETNCECGTHTHYDMRNESELELARIAYAYVKTYRLWERFVSRGRAGNYYCVRSDNRSRDIRDAYESGNVKSLINNWDKYIWINLSAYRKHKTFENRLLEGTLDRVRIKQWVRLNALFIDAVKDMTFAEIDAWFGQTKETMFEGLEHCIDNAELTTYWGRHAR